MSTSNLDNNLLFYWTEIQFNLQSFLELRWVTSIELIVDSHHYCRNRLDLRLEDTGLRPVAVGWIVEHIDSTVVASDLIVAHTDWSAGDTGWTPVGTGSIFGDIDSIFAGTDLTVVATGSIAERIGSIVVGTDLTFGDIG